MFFLSFVSFLFLFLFVSCSDNSTNFPVQTGPQQLNSNMVKLTTYLATTGKPVAVQNLVKQAYQKILDQQKIPRTIGDRPVSNNASIIIRDSVHIQYVNQDLGTGVVEIEVLLNPISGVSTETFVTPDTLRRIDIGMGECFWYRHLGYDAVSNISWSNLPSQTRVELDWDNNGYPTTHYFYDQTYYLSPLSGGSIYEVHVPTAFIPICGQNYRVKIITN